MSLLHAFILGIVEGITEFLPVSSTGHLILVGYWLGERDEAATVFEVFIQLGAILAVLWHYKGIFLDAARPATREPGARWFFATLLIAFVPAAVAGFLAHDWIKLRLFNPTVVGMSLVIGGVVMLGIERWHHSVAVSGAAASTSAKSLDFRTALGIGLAQVLALVPGVSRSGATIMGGMSLGLTRPVATEFSFFLAVPVMIAATLYDLLKSRDILTTADAPAFGMGLIVSFLGALVVVRWLLRYVSDHSFVGFAWYRIVAGAALLVTSRTW